MIETAGPGGAETVFLDLIRSLNPRDWKSIAVIPSSGWLNDQLVAAGVETLIIPERSTFDAAYFARLLSLIRRSRVDIIHSHLFGSAVRGALLSFVSGKPAIATLHGQTDMSSSERFLSIKIAALKHLRRIVFVSEELRKSFVKHTPLGPRVATVITNGIDTERFAGRPAGLRAELGIGPDEFVIGTVGNPGRAKGFDVLIEAAAILKERGSRVRFVVAGDLSDGRGSDMLALRSARGLDDDVLFIGFRRDVEKVLGALDLYLLPSRSEGFSLSIVEAMAAGLPVVSTRCGGPEGILEHGVTGILVENESPTAIANAIEELRADPAKARALGADARVVVRQRYTRDAQIKAYEKLYTECLAA